MNFRTIVLAGALALGASLSAGTAAASPASAILGMPAATAAESAVTQAHYRPYFHRHYHYGFRRLCRLPFFVLAKRFGYWRARMIKRRCYRPYYGFGYGY